MRGAGSGNTPRRLYRSEYEIQIRLFMHHGFVCVRNVQQGAQSRGDVGARTRCQMDDAGQSCGKSGLKTASARGFGGKP